MTVKNLKNCVVIESVNEAASDAEPDATVERDRLADLRLPLSGLRCRIGDRPRHP